MVGKQAMIFASVILATCNLDFINDKVVDVVGNISLVNIESAGAGFILSYDHGNGNYEHIIADCVEVSGDDSRLLVKSLSKANDTIYNRLFHVAGIQIDKHDTLNYDEFYHESSMLRKYHWQVN